MHRRKHKEKSSHTSVVHQHRRENEAERKKENKKTKEKANKARMYDRRMRRQGQYDKLKHRSRIKDGKKKKKRFKKKKEKKKSTQPVGMFRKSRSGLSGVECPHCELQVETGCSDV